MSDGRITPAQKAYLSSLVCQRISADKANREYIQKFINSRNPGLAYSLKSGWSDDTKDKIAYYIVREPQPDGDPLLFFSLKCGEIDVPYNLEKLRTAMEDYRAVDERLLGELGRNATLEEIALEMHITPEEAEMVRDTLDSARLLSQARAASAPKEEEPEEEQHVEDTALFQMRQRIMDLLSNVSEADAKLLTLRVGLEGGLPLSPEETGRKLGLTPEEVIQREAAALSALRNS